MASRTATLSSAAAPSTATVPVPRRGLDLARMQRVRRRQDDGIDVGHKQRVE